MTLSAVKERLHGYIEQDDEKKVHAIYTLPENEITDGKPIYDDETIACFEQLREQFISSKHPGFTVKESISNIKNRLKKHDL